LKKVILKWTLFFSLFTLIIFIFSLIYKNSLKSQEPAAAIEDFKKEVDYHAEMPWQPISDEDKPYIDKAFSILLDFTKYIEQGDLRYIYDNMFYDPSKVSYKKFEEFISSKFIIGASYTPSITYHRKETDGRFIMNVAFKTFDDSVAIPYSEESGGYVNQPTNDVELIIEMFNKDFGDKFAIVGLEHDLNISEYESPTVPAPTDVEDDPLPTTSLRISNLKLLRQSFPQHQIEFINETLVPLILDDLPKVAADASTDPENYYTNNMDTLLLNYSIEKKERFTLLHQQYQFKKEDVQEIQVIEGSVNDIFNVDNIMGFKLNIVFNDGTSKIIGVQILKKEPLLIRLYPLPQN
jgi:hypothetical protein